MQVLNIADVIRHFRTFFVRVVEFRSSVNCARDGYYGPFQTPVQMWSLEVESLPPLRAPF